MPGRSPHDAATGDAGRHAVRGAVVASAWTLLSRLLGFARDAFMAAVFGMSPLLGAFSLAWVVPNLFRRLFGEGAVSAAVQPALARAEREEGAGAAGRLYAGFHGFLLVLLAGLVLAGEAVLLAWRALLPDEPAAAEARRTLGYAAVLLPYLLPICLTALAAAPQNLRRRFLRPALAPALLNLAWIAGLAAALLASPDPEARMAWVCGAVLAGGVLQWGMQQAGVRAAGWPLRPRFGARDERLRVALRAFAPALLGMAAVQINVALDQVLVRALVDPSANAFTYLANRMLHLPLALVGIAATTGATPLLARLAADGRIDEMGRALRRGCESTLVLILAAGAGLWVVAHPALQLLFERGAFVPEDTALLTRTLRAYLWCLPAAALGGLLARAHQVRGSYAEPAWFAVAAVPVNLVLDLLLLPRFGVVAAGWATAAALTVQVLLLAARLPARGLGAPLAARRLILLPLPAAAAAAALVAAIALPRDFRALLGALHARFGDRGGGGDS